jgi:hypothetical protein
LDVSKQATEPWSLHGAAGVAAVVIAVSNEVPAFMALTQHIGLTSLALGIEGVELLLEALLGRLARINGAAERLCSPLNHGLHPTK